MESNEEDANVFFDGSKLDEYPLLNEKTDDDRLEKKINSSHHGFLRRHGRKALSILCLLSVTLNIALCMSLVVYIRQQQVTYDHSTYAGLSRDNEIAFEWATDYATENLTLAAELWDGIDFDPGFVALPYDWTESKSLPRAQPFPWDKNQGLYVLNGYHALHCLKNIHRSIRQYHLGLPQSLPLMHITHCMDALRGDILCYADDTPRYTTVTKSPESAVGQIRQCRDWAMLEKWAKERTSCYNYISHEADHIDQFERFKFCPPDSPYWPEVRKHFHKGSDWMPVTGDDITLVDGFESITDSIASAPFETVNDIHG